MLLLIQYTLIFASVLVLVALGGCFSEHSGVINIGLEGIMVMGALGGALMMKYLPAGMAAPVIIVLVILASALAGMLFSLLLGVAAVSFKADQTLVGTALNLLGPAIAVVLVRAINTAESVDNVSSAVSYGQPKKAFVAYLGKFEFNVCMLIAFLVLIAAYIVLYRTKLVYGFVPAANILRRQIPWESMYIRCAMQESLFQEHWEVSADLYISPQG